MAAINLDKVDSLNISREKDRLELAQLAEECYQSSRPYITRLAQIWDENIRFFEGDQYIYYNTSNKKWEIIPVTKYNDFIPRPTTNLILPIVNTLVSLLTKSKPSASTYPNSDNPTDVNAAKLSAMIIDSKWEMDKEQIKLIDSALIALLCGTVYRKDYFDSGKGGFATIDTDDGTYHLPVGDNGVDILSPFEVTPDIEHDSYYVEARVQSLTWVKSVYGKKGNGYTGLADTVKAEKNLSTVLSYRERLRTSTGIGSNGLSPSNSSPTMAHDSTVVVEMYIRPTTKHKKGLMVVEAGGVPLYVKESPYFHEAFEDSWHPYTECVWTKSPLRRHGVSLVENLVPLQRRLNGIDSLIILNRQTNASPQWLIPHGSGVPEGYINGRPGLNIPFRPVGANGAAPQKIPGAALTADVHRERENLIREMHQIAMDNEVMSGTQPSGVNTATALNMLLEQTFTKFNPYIQRWEKFVEGGQQKKLLIIQKFYKEPRPQLMAFMRNAFKDTTDVEIKDFIGADLRDNLNVRIESGSSLPRSKVVEQSQLMELAKLGVLGPIGPENPEANQEFLEKFGLTSFSTIKNMDLESAKHVVRVLHDIEQGKLPQEAFPQIHPYDDLKIHLLVLTDEMKRAGFEDKMGLFNARYEQLTSIMMASQAGQMGGAPIGSPNQPAAEPGMEAMPDGNPMMPPPGASGQMMGPPPMM